jgi:hypothetical protein
MYPSPSGSSPDARVDTAVVCPVCLSVEAAGAPPGSAAVATVPTPSTLVRSALPSSRAESFERGLMGPPAR